MKPGLDTHFGRAVTSAADGVPIRHRCERPAISWGAASAEERGPIVATLRNRNHRNAIGTHAGGYSVYRALAIAARALKPDQLADLTDTLPADRIGPHPQWTSAQNIVSLDPWGHLVGEAFRDDLARGYDIRPTIAVTRAHIDMPEIRAAIEAGRIKADGEIVRERGNVRVMKAAIDPVWYLPGIAERFGVSEADLRRGLHEQTGGMYPELVEREDIKVFLPPIGGTTIYCFGDPAKLSDGKTPLACRVHDECNGSDVFGSDICTCRPYLAHGIEICIQMAQAGGVGVILCQWGKALGATVIGTVGSEDKGKIAKENGADHIIYYTKEDFAAKVKEITGGKLCDVVYDGIGKTTFPASLDCIRPLGMFASFGSASGQVEAFNINILQTKGSLFATRPTLNHYCAKREDLLATANDLFQVVASGAVKIPINQKLPLKEAQKAHRDLEGRATTGSTILVP